MELKDFRVLLEIEKLRSISLAARSLYVSQPGLSQSLHSYEQQIGFQIFERVSHGVTPTVMGKRYLALIHSIVEIYDEGMKELRDDKKRTIRFGIGDQRGALLIPVIIPLLNTTYSEFKIQIDDTVSSRTLLLDALKEGVIDAACTTIINEDYGTAGNIQVYPLVKEEIMLVVPKAHTIVRKLVQDEFGNYWINPKDLNGQTYILCDSKREIRKMSDQIFWNLNISNVNVLQSSTSLFTVINSCMNCNALTFSPWEYVSNTDQCICASLGQQGISWTHIMMVRSDVLKWEETQILLELLRKSLIRDMKNLHVSECDVMIKKD